MKARRITRDRLMALLHYDPETGIFTWMQDVRGGRNQAFLMAAAGTVAGGLGSFGYWVLSVDTERIAAHRLAFFYMTGEWPPSDIDHQDGDRTNNRWANIRPVTRAENMQNLKGAHKDSKTGLLGTFRHRNKFQARIMTKGKRINLGEFDTAEAAHAAYLKAKRQLHEKGTL